jgi:hypothetical protein
VEKPDPYVSSDSSPDSDSDGSQPLKLSNNPADVASRRLWMRKRACDDEQLPPLHPLDLHVVPHIPGASNTAGTSSTAGASNMAGASGTPGTSIIVGASNIAGASDTTGANDNAGIGGMLLALALQGASNIAGARASAGTDNNPGTSGSVGANQPFSTTYPMSSGDNLRMLEIRANMDTFGAPTLPQTALCGSNTVAMWRRQYK